MSRHSNTVKEEWKEGVDDIYANDAQDVKRIESGHFDPTCQKYKTGTGPVET